MCIAQNTDIKFWHKQPEHFVTFLDIFSKSIELIIKSVLSLKMFHQVSKLITIQRLKTKNFHNIEYLKHVNCTQHLAIGNVTYYHFTITIFPLSLKFTRPLEVVTFLN